jgi:hypothetical protein|tara:strand:+ start:270 stop:686 length:417 start_codon:yes stop_codon:yes gene_type:complete
MKLLIENWRRYLVEENNGESDIDRVDSYFKNFLKDTKRMGHIFPKHSIDELPKWLRMGVKGIHPIDFARSPAWYSTSFAKALEYVSDENRERFRKMFLLLADAIEKGDVNAEHVLLNWHQMATLIDAAYSEETGDPIE